MSGAYLVRGAYGGLVPGCRTCKVPLGSEHRSWCSGGAVRGGGLGAPVGLPPGSFTDFIGEPGKCLDCGYHVCSCVAVAKFVAPEPEQKPVRVGWRKAPAPYAFERDDGRAAVWGIGGPQSLAGKQCAGCSDCRDLDRHYRCDGGNWQYLVHQHAHASREAAMAWADAKLAEEDAAAKREAKPLYRCIDATPPPNSHERLKLGEVYTPDFVADDGWLKINGINWRADRFEPAEESEPGELPDGWAAQDCGRPQFEHTTGVRAWKPDLGATFWYFNTIPREPAIGTRATRAEAMIAALGIEQKLGASGEQYFQNPKTQRGWIEDHESDAERAAEKVLRNGEALRHMGVTP